MLRSNLFDDVFKYPSPKSYEKGDQTSVKNTGYSKSGNVIGNVMLKVSFMRKKLFPEDQINFLCSNMCSD